MTIQEDDSNAGAISDSELPPEERINKPNAPDDAKIPAEGDSAPVRPSENDDDTEDQ